MKVDFSSLHRFIFMHGAEPFTLRESVGSLTRGERSGRAGGDEKKVRVSFSSVTRSVPVSHLP